MPSAKYSCARSLERFFRGSTAREVILGAFASAELLRARMYAVAATSTAMAHHLARLFYRMIKYGSEYVDHGVAAYEARFREQQMRWLSKKAAELHLCLAPLPNSAALVSGE
jgi:hypothetical protein